MLSSWPCELALAFLAINRAIRVPARGAVQVSESAAPQEGGRTGAATGLQQRSEPRRTVCPGASGPGATARPEELALRVFFLACAGITLQIAVVAILIL
jgi:hypothetical protein